MKFIIKVSLVNMTKSSTENFIFCAVCLNKSSFLRPIKKRNKLNQKKFKEINKNFPERKVSRISSCTLRENKTP